MSKRLDKTLADYVVGGVMPALLIGLLVSLCHFLLELALSGQNLGQLKWVLFFFIVGTVLIARIAMRGDIADRAAVYGIALAIAAGLALVRFVEIPQTALGGLGWLVPIALMSVIWWSAHKLTLDSTFDEEAELEEEAGLFDAAPAPAAAGKQSKNQQDWFGEYQAEREAEQKRKKPGTMLIYFSLAALPLFGLGQAILPATDHERRRYAFWLLTLYVACGLGMLLTTSFLGLRRYLRGRRLQMPAAMTGMWLGLGAALIFTLMFLSAYLLPRPEAEYHLSQLLGWAGSKQRDANRTHFFEGSSGKDNENASGAKRSEPQKGEQAGDARDGQRGEGRGKQQGGSSSGRQSGERNSRSGGGRNNPGQGERSGQGEQSRQQGEQGSQGQGNKGQGKDQSQQGDGKSGAQGGQSGGNQKDGQRQPGQRGEQDSKGKGGGQTPDKEGERGNREQGQGQGDKPPEQQRNDPNDPGQQQQRQQNEDRNGQNQGESPKEQDQGSGSGSQQEQQQQPQQSPPPASSMSWDWVNWIIYALIAAGVLFALWKWGRQIWTALLQMWRELLAWWNGLFAGKDAATAGEELPDPESKQPPQPFAWFSNPLLTPGRFKSMEEMIRYSFAALHSWAYEQNLGRQPDETPTEFALRLGHHRQRVHQDVRKLADLYAVVTYARVNPPASSETILRNFWNRLAEEPTRPVVVN